jgi:hypothetical protein
VRNSRPHADSGWIGQRGSNVVTTDNQWHNVIVTFDASNDNYDIYVDPTAGMVNGQSSTVINMNGYNEHTNYNKYGYADETFTVGRSLVTGGLYDIGQLVGDFDDIAVWDNCLKGAALQQLITQGPLSFLGCAEANNCDQCAATDCAAADWSSVPAKVGAGCAVNPCPQNTAHCCTQHATCAAGNCTGTLNRNAFAGPCAGLVCATNTAECCEFSNPFLELMKDGNSAEGIPSVIACSSTSCTAKVPQPVSTHSALSNKLSTTRVFVQAPVALLKIDTPLPCAQTRAHGHTHALTRTRTRTHTRTH